MFAPCGDGFPLNGGRVPGRLGFQLLSVGERAGKLDPCPFGAITRLDYRSLAGFAGLGHLLKGYNAGPECQVKSPRIGGLSTSDNTACRTGQRPPAGYRSIAYKPADQAGEAGRHHSVYRLVIGQVELGGVEPPSPDAPTCGVHRDRSGSAPEVIRR